MVKGLVKFETACTMIEQRPSMLTQAPSNCSKGDYSPVTRPSLADPIFRTVARVRNSA